MEESSLEHKSTKVSVMYVYRYYTHIRKRESVYITGLRIMMAMKTLSWSHDYFVATYTLPVIRRLATRKVLKACAYSNGPLYTANKRAFSAR